MTYHNVDKVIKNTDNCSTYIRLGTGHLMVGDFGSFNIVYGHENDKNEVTSDHASMTNSVSGANRLSDAIPELDWKINVDCG